MRTAQSSPALGQLLALHGAAGASTPGSPLQQHHQLRFPTTQFLHHQQHAQYHLQPSVPSSPRFAHHHHQSGASSPQVAAYQHLAYPPQLVLGHGLGQLQYPVLSARASPVPSLMPMPMLSSSNGAKSPVLLDYATASLLSQQESVLSSLRASNREKVVRMYQFLAGSAVGFLLFLSVLLVSPPLWHSASTAGSSLDDPFTAISRDFLMFLALFLIGACQVLAF
jgi:hypothetical protein